MNNPDIIAEIPVNLHLDKLPLAVFFISPKSQASLVFGDIKNPDTWYPDFDCRGERI